MTGHNDKSNTLSLVAFCCLYYIVFLPLSQHSVKMSCFVFVVNRSLFSQSFANWRSTHMWGSVLLICSYLYRCVWFKVVFLCVCVFAVFYTCVLSSFRCCCCNGAQQGRGATLCESDSTIFTPPMFLSLVPLVLCFFLKMSCFSWYNLWNSIISLFLQDLSFHYLWLYMYMSMHERTLL